VLITKAVSVLAYFRKSTGTESPTSPARTSNEGDGPDGETCAHTLPVPKWDGKPSYVLGWLIDRISGWGTKSDGGADPSFV
jgi:hypothetical protein